MGSGFTRVRTSDAEDGKDAPAAGSRVSDRTRQCRRACSALGCSSSAALPALYYSTYYISEPGQ
jgi:hypothetical protein